MADADRGRRLGPYRLGDPVGRGGFATVYRARDERFDHDVAVKVLAENHSLDPDIRERFLDEARLLRRLDSPDMVRMLDMGETDDLQPYLVLTFADRGDLRHRVEELRRSGHDLHPGDVLPVVRVLAAALRLMHPLGIVHRDLSPGNILIVSVAPGDERSVPSPTPRRLAAPDERLILADLGYAKDLRDHSGLTVGGGTKGFQAPEQRAGLARIDARADIYGATAVVAWLVTGIEPDHLAASDLEVEFRRLEVARRLAGVLATGMALEPGQRYSDIDQWERELVAALAPPPGGPPNAPVDRVASLEVDAPSGRPAWPTRIAVVMALLALGALAGLVAGRSTGSDEARVTRLDDGRVRVTDAESDVVAAVFGPDRVRVGQAITFEAGITGAVDYRWITPSGEVVEGTPSMTITATSPGAATIALLATGPDGIVVTAVHRFVAES